MFLTVLRCLRCGAESPPDPAGPLCPRCGPGSGADDPGILDARYDYAAAAPVLRAAVSAAEPRDIRRYLPLLPIARAAATLLPGGTPLVPSPRLARRLGLGALYLKDERANPVQCLKDRATFVAVSLATDLGQRDLYCASAGNAAISLAGFCAHGGLRAHVFVPAAASPTRLAWLHRFGADVTVSAGDYDQAYAEAEAAGRAHGWYSRNCAFNPYLVEGKKTAAFEIAEALGWSVPDYVAAPVGDGCTLGAIGKGFRELVSVGLTRGLPGLVGVQAEAVQPLVRRYRGEPPGAPAGDTAAASIRVGTPRNAVRLLGELAAAGGTMVAVSDAEITESQRLLAMDAGIVAEFTSAASLAGLARLAAGGILEGRTAVAVITGGRVD